MKKEKKIHVEGTNSSLSGQNNRSDREDHGPGEASDLLRGGLGGPSLGLDVLEDCAPSAALLLLVGHNFPDCEALLATRGAHLPEAEHYMWAGGKWGCGTNG